MEGYSEVLQVYKDAAKVWDVKISIPRERQAAKAYMEKTGSSVEDWRDFELALINTGGIPLNLYLVGDTGLGDVATTYNLTVTHSGKWMTIPGDSVALICTQATELAEDVFASYRGRARPGRRPKRQTPRSEPVSAQALYDEAQKLKATDPAKSLDLLQEAEQRAGGQEMFNKAFFLSEEITTNPNCLYLLAVKFKTSDPEKAHGYMRKAWECGPSEDLQSNLKVLQPELAYLLAIKLKASDPEKARAYAELALQGQPSDELQSRLKILQAELNQPSESEVQMRTIFKDWAKQRGEALKRARGSKAQRDAYMQTVDQRLVHDLTRKYGITHEELDRIEAYGAEQNWW